MSILEPARLLNGRLRWQRAITTTAIPDVPGNA